MASRCHFEQSDRDGVPLSFRAKRAEWCPIVISSGANEVSAVEKSLAVRFLHSGAYGPSGRNDRRGRMTDKTKGAAIVIATPSRFMLAEG